MARIQEFLFTTVKANDFGNECEISVTCRSCQESINFIDTFERLFEKRREWIEDHTCNIANIHTVKIDISKYSTGCN